MAQKPMFKRVAQVGMVVKDLDEAVKKQWEEYGIGPWNIYTFDPSTVRDMSIRGERVDYAMRIGLAMIDDVMWELIQPLDDRSIYAEHLKEHGEGLHHVLFEVEDFDAALARFKEKRIDVLQSGDWQGLKYAYFDVRSTMSCISEICIFPREGEDFPSPERTYP